MPPVPYKEAYLHCRQDDILVIQSPLKLPLRVIRNRFVDRILRGEKMPFSCPYRCLATCEPDTSPYCIAQALVNAYRGDMERRVRHLRGQCLSRRSDRLGARPDPGARS